VDGRTDVDAERSIVTSLTRSDYLLGATLYNITVMSHLQHREFSHSCLVYLLEATLYK